ncbi:MAG: DUF669 domain-containing protein [Armatimonadota bacterium]
MSQDYDHSLDTGTDVFDLVNYQSTYAVAAAQEQGFDDLPEGKYQVKVEMVELVRTKAKHEPMLKWTFKVIAPSCVGRLLWKNTVISHDNMKYLKTDLHTCGLDLVNLTDLPGRLHELLDMTLEINKRIKGGNDQIYINRRIVTADPFAVEAPASLSRF